MLEAIAVERTYRHGQQRVEVLKGLGVTLEAGQLLVIAGRSGSGKTTLLHILTGLDRPDAGMVRYNGMRVDPCANEADLLRWRRSVGFLHQTPILVPTLSAWENALLPLRYWGRADRAWVNHLFTRLGLADLKHRRPRELSGGQATRVALARALARRSPLLLSDEPTGRLDAETAGEVWQLLLEVNREEGVTVVVVTHDPVILGSGPEVAWLEGGRLTRPA